ncbi:NAD(P)/FAD-dependent oxidoreductase [Lampropedia puyangensis]|uniref:NAD(P)/FAD-dependent oxidoreductase n=1 Tax=Lampropedia puyangensis TaxID=1330072 RepID=A0A4S8FBG2_9BURK|nr:NAD(P)/FAD-dependent oxidoreductase [Lampropedia puyangensis]THU04155.1 NAD(P)/FAD-dependent oxidoreductase [Lampropedia puyangensis]
MVTNFPILPVHTTLTADAPTDKPSFAASSIEAQSFDAIVIGAGAAGLFCAAQAGALGLRVLVLDHAKKLAEKIRISGGGRCNFTNRDLDVRQPQQHFISDNPHFCRSALSRFTPQHFTSLLQSHGIAFHEKHKGQLFCDHSAQDVITMLQGLCAQAGVKIWNPCEVHSVVRQEGEAHQERFVLTTSLGAVQSAAVVVATGGLSIPKIGATDLGYRIAAQFAIPLIARRPGLVPLTFASSDWATYVGLAGLAMPVDIATGQGKNKTQFKEDLLFTHRGLSGPAILQISNYWQPGTPIAINLLPEMDVLTALLEAKRDSKRLLANVLAQWLPARLVEVMVAQQPQWLRAIDQVPDKALTALAQQLQAWQITPSGTEGYAKAEVTLGGVDTRALSSKTMESSVQPDLYFIGEVVDVTGWLGGYNFQWAWASAYACAQAMADKRRTSV